MEVNKLNLKDIENRLKSIVKDNNFKLRKGYEIEDTIKYLIALIKGNNLGAANLFKRCQETQKFIEKSGTPDFSEDLMLIRDKVVNMRNLDEEIVRSAERSKIQLNDIKEEVQNQKTVFAEAESDVLHLLDSVEESFR